MRTIKLGDLSLDYWEAGNGTPLVFIHGVATSGELWVEDLAALAPDTRIITYNRRGYGTSSPAPRNWDAHMADAAALIEALNAAPAVLVGYSAGSIIALGLALQRPELVKGIVLLDPAFNLKRCLTLSLIKTLATIKLQRLAGRDSAAAVQWLRYVSSYSTGGSAFDSKASDERREKLVANAGGIFADMASGGGSVDEERLASIRAPVTLVDAGLSPDFLRKSCHRLSKLMPQAHQVTLDHCGHWIGVDARDELIGILRSAAT